MSDDSEDNAAKVPATKVPRKRPAPRKVAKPKAVEAAAEAPPAVEVERKPEPVAEAREARPMVVRDARTSESRSAEARESDSRDSGPEPIPFFVENTNSEPPGNSKKRRRRKKKHGQSQGQQPSQAAAPAGEFYPPQAPEAAAPAPVMHAAPRPKLDSDEVSRKAWKIFLSEVGEEGLALIDDHDAREISRRCFRLAEIFLEEASRRNR